MLLYIDPVQVAEDSDEVGLSYICTRNDQRKSILEYTSQVSFESHNGTTCAKEDCQTSSLLQTTALSRTLSDKKFPHSIKLNDSDESHKKSRLRKRSLNKVGERRKKEGFIEPKGRCGLAKVRNPKITPYPHN